MLKNTLILYDDAMAGELLADAIADLNVILMLIFGGNEMKQAVEWADQLCEKAKLSNGGNGRHVVWVKNRDLPSVQAILTPIFRGARPVVGVLNFYDKLKGSISDLGEVDPITLELAFIEGGAT